ncbi:MAG: bifunctional proline dehydrogenase/L-glutamate gamma-semialdehyde dehydrogenase PutA [Pseudomonadota bacterium]
MTPLAALRARIRADRRAPEAEILERLQTRHGLDAQIRDRAARRGADLVRDIRENARPGLMEVFLEEYGLSTEEGVALMCLAEALLRVPDAETMDALIEDKIAASAWSEHLGQSSSPLVNASTWALLLTGKVLDPEPAGGVVGVLKGAIRRLGEPVIRTAVKQSMKELGRQFVLGRDIGEGMARATGLEAEGFAYSYDMLGEAALTERDAQAFYRSYEGAIRAIAKACKGSDVRTNPGISVKLSALHPRYQVAQAERARAELTPRVLDLALQAREAGMGFNIDAEEADRLDLSLDVIEATLRDPRLAGWDGFGVVVQAYSKRCDALLDWLHTLSAELDRRIMVRLVKGAYWDAEIKRAQIDGVPDFPVFTRKAATDVAYLCAAKKLLGMTDRIYPQFATHNAHTTAAILELAGADRERFEFQRLHGMGESLHALLRKRERTRCRIYAPVGPHKDLLAYLVRRLLENGANSSFVNQIVDESVAPETVARDPFEALQGAPVRVTPPGDLFAPERRNSRGWDLTNDEDLEAFETARSPFRTARWEARPMLAVAAQGGRTVEIVNPARPDDLVGAAVWASREDVEAALAAATPWDAPTPQRRQTLDRAADLYEAHAGELFAILGREAGKTPADAVAEIREAVDFLRYYGAQAEAAGPRAPRGLFACVSPWNFPLAIFSGQIAAALAAGNGVLAKPAEATPLIAARAVALLHEAGVPTAALQLLPGEGAVVGAALTSDPRVDGVCFTGSTATAQGIHRAMAERLDPDAPLIAETGGLNAMIVDSTALPEQAIKDILISSFQSAGQRCSALRMLYVQEDVAEPFFQHLFGAMDELALGDPWALSTDVGPVIDARARDGIEAHVAQAAAEGRVLKRLAAPEAGWFVSPTVIKVRGIQDLEREVFGPVLHVATFKAADLDRVIDAVNDRGYGLTFGLHTRIDSRVQHVAGRIRVGNLYVNRNQIGAVVGSQPFGGEGLSGTGPKAGGPAYLNRFVAAAAAPIYERAPSPAPSIDVETAQAAIAAAPRPSETPISAEEMPGVTGETNRLSTVPRGLILCLGPDAEAAARQGEIARSSGCEALEIAPGARGPRALHGVLALEALRDLRGIDGVALWGDAEMRRAARRALAAREGPILPLFADADFAERCLLERHLCVDTTAAGGNASLLAEQS